MAVFQDAFISYGRTDSKAFAIQLKDRLAAAGLSVWFDFDDIPLATDFQERIDNGIERSYAFLYVISPSSVNSPYCDKELNLALRCGKRIIPIMHVEAIDRDVWQQRNPIGTEEDWQAFQTAKKHSSFENLNETVSKLNWIFFSEGHDFEQSLQGLLSLFPLHQDYVQRHTQLLLQALTWERNHRQTRYLLVGNERIEAEKWLNIHFADEAAPCEPTPLHCEFITEATKNANNLMTQVFLCHDDQDQDTAEQIRQSLMRRGITVWNYRTDIQTSQDYHGAIARGLEEADNVIFILSPHAAQSDYCQRELAMALQLHKRVIPILAAPTDDEMVPDSLKSLQYIDLTDNSQASDYLADESELLKQLNTEAAYYTEHKTWLTQALKWERQQQNPTMLLRGYNLRRAENWLKVARTHGQPPTELQEQFIAESLRQPSDGALDVFVSYSRVDADFARRLNEALQIQGKRTWFDQESIATGADFQQEICRGIENSDVFLFVLSPQSVASPYCADEVEYAESLNKRMVTVLHRPVDVGNLHPVLAKLQWLDFRDHDGDFQVNFQELLRTLDTDREHLEIHTRLLGRALEWDRGGRDESLLLRGQNLGSAEGWLVSNGEVEPRPTGLQQEYVRAGHALQAAKDSADRKLRRGVRLGVWAAALGILLAIGSSWYSQTKIAKANQLLQGARLEKAGLEAFNQSEFEQIQALLKAIQAGRSLQESIEATDLNNVSDYTATSPILTLQQIQAAADQIPNRLLAHGEKINSANFSSDGTLMVTASSDGTARVWDLKNSKNSILTTLEGHEAEVTSASLSPDGTQVLTISADGTARVWDLKRDTFSPLKGDKEEIWSASFSPDGTQIVSVSRDNKLRAWNLEFGTSSLLEGDKEEIWSASFSPDATRAVSVLYSPRLRVWNLESGTSSLLEGSSGGAMSASFSPDGTQVVSVPAIYTSHLKTLAAGGQVKVWDLKSGSSTLLEGHEQEVYNASFSPDGTQVVTASEDDTARVWDLKSGTSIPLEGHEQGVLHASFSPDGTQVVTASGDGTARVWDLQSGTSTPLEGHEQGMYDASFSPDGTQVVTTSREGTARIWDLESRTSTPLEGHEQEVKSASFSPDGTQVVITSREGVTAQVWDLKTSTFNLLEGHEKEIIHASFSPDGTQVVTASWDETARVWDLENSTSIPLDGHEQAVTYALFSPDGTQVVTASSDGTARVWDLKGRQLAIFEIAFGNLFNFPFVNLSSDGQRVTAMQNGKILTHEILTLPELLDWGCQWLDNYLKYGPVTDADRELCGLPPRDDSTHSDTVSSANTSALAVSPFVSDMSHSAMVDPSFFPSAPQTDA